MAVESDNLYVRCYSRREFGIVAIVATAAFTGACSKGPPSSSPTVRSPDSVQAVALSGDAVTQALTVASDDCANVSGHQYAQRGNLSIGPFLPGTLSLPPAYDEAKIWVASQRDGHDDAELTILRPDGSTEQQTRPSGQASVTNARQFYPGTIHIRGAGSYRIDADVGPDHICVIADYAPN